MPSFGELLSAHLQRTGMPQKICAELIGQKPSNLSAIIHGRRAPPWRRLETWMDKLQVPAGARAEWAAAALAARPQAEAMAQRLQAEIAAAQRARVDGRRAAVPADAYRPDPDAGA